MAALVPGGHVAAIVVVSVAFGAGIGFTTPVGVELQMGSVPPERAGIAAGVNETIVEAGGALGVAVLGTVLAIGVHGTVGLGELTGSAGAAARDDFAAAVPAPLLVAAGVVVVLAAVGPVASGAGGASRPGHRRRGRGRLTAPSRPRAGPAAGRSPTLGSRSDGGMGGYCGVVVVVPGFARTGKLMTAVSAPAAGRQRS